MPSLSYTTKHACFVPKVKNSDDRLLPLASRRKGSEAAFGRQNRLRRRPSAKTTGSQVCKIHSSSHPELPDLQRCCCDSKDGEAGPLERQLQHNRFSVVGGRCENTVVAGQGREGEGISVEEPATLERRRSFVLMI